MLTNLSIKNFALIENISVDFKDDLSIITGETGAGKSILLGALGLVLGKRADLSVFKDPASKCIVEGTFNVSNYALESFFEDHDIDFEYETIIRRELLPSGKSRAFVNDTPTTLNVLQSLSEVLVDVHSQHQTLKLSDANFQFEIIDAIAFNAAKIASYKRGLSIFKKLKKELDLMRLEQENAQKDYEYNLHLYEELSKCDLKIDEQEVLEKKLDQLNNVEEIKLILSELHALGTSEEVGIDHQLYHFVQLISKIKNYDEGYANAYERIHSLKIEFSDLAGDIERWNEMTEFDPDELERVNDRLQLLFDLQKKHGVSSVEELLAVQGELEERIEVVQNSSADIKAKQVEMEDVSSKIDKLAADISSARQEAIPVFTEKITSFLSALGMENSRIKMNIQFTDTYFENGKDRIEFLISADKGNSFGILKKIASGGELSRIMLSIKAIMSGYLKLPTIIFDEIDTGVSGDVSQKMAEIMRQMSENMQVITITHLPQIAAKGKHHFKVYKEEVNGTIETQLRSLTADERINEIAEMLSGKMITSTAVEHAKQLLN